MNLLEAILLGIVQGATEFLPVSSSGHLVIVPALLRLAEPNRNFIAIAHGGTLLAVLIYFWRDIWQIAAAWLDGLRRRQPMATVESRVGWFIIVGSIPAAFAGLFLSEQIDAIFASPVAAGIFLLGTAALLVFAESRLTGNRPLANMRWLDAILIGLAQMVALLPGISRSGSTMAAGIAQGLDRATAARYSFLLGIPAIGGAALLSLLDLRDAPDLAAQMPGLMAAFVAAALVGYACIAFLLNYLRRRSLYSFAIYCATVAVIFLVVAAVRGV